MKIFRMLSVVIFLLAAAVPNVAQAAAGEKIGFIRLLSTVDPNSSVQMQARRAFLRITPSLLALQSRGVILEFEPEFAVGVVKVKYAAGHSILTAMGALPVYSSVHDARVLPNSVAPAVRLGPASAPPFTPFFALSLYTSCFSVFNLNPSDHVVGSMHDTTGRVVATYEGDADGFGEILNDCFSWAGSFSHVTPGYSLIFNVYDTTATLVGTYNAKVPPLAFTGITNSTAVVRGAGPAGKQYQLEWIHPNWDAAEDLTVSTAAGVIGASRKWSSDLGSKRFRGGDELDYFELQNDHFEFGISMMIPSVYCQLGSNYCESSGFAFQPARISIAHGGSVYNFSGIFNAFGIFSAPLRNAGRPIYLKAGDKIGASGFGTYSLPALTSKVDFSTNVVSGKVPPNKYFELWAYTGCGCSTSLIYSHSDNRGNYAGDFTSQVDLIDTEATTIEVFYQDPASGNVTDYFHSYGP